MGKKNGNRDLVCKKNKYRRQFRKSVQPMKFAFFWQVQKGSLLGTLLKEFSEADNGDIMVTVETLKENMLENIHLNAKIVTFVLVMYHAAV